MVLNLSNFIYSLLLENETVIIPGFGAFVSTYKPAEILDNEIKPPSKEISFTQQIKNNDGMLAEIIARKAKISQSYAMKRIEKARENMLYELDKGEIVIIENIGSLVYGENNKIEFTPFKDENLLLDSFGLEAVSTEDTVQKADIKHNETEVIEETEVQVDEKSIDLTNHESEKEPVEEEEKKVDTEFNQTIEIEPVFARVEVPEKNDFTEFVGKENSKKEEKKKFGWYWYLLILIPLFIIGYFIVNNKSKTIETKADTKESLNIRQQDIHHEAVAPVDTVEKNPTVTVETESKSDDSTEFKLSNEAKKYYLIGGGFKSEEKAEKYILKIKENGLNGFLVGKKGSLYLVGVDSFDNETEAQEALNKLVKANPGWNIWIYEK